MVLMMGAGMRDDERKAQLHGSLEPVPRRWSRCPRCGKPTHERKFPLLVGIRDQVLVREDRVQMDGLRAHTADIQAYHTLFDPRRRWMPADGSA
jgi:hypothetical protein